MKWQVREAKITDYSGAVALMQEVYLLHYRQRPDLHKKVDKPLTKTEFKEILAAEQQILLVVIAVPFNEVAAICQLDLKDTFENENLVNRRYAYLNDLCVAKKYRRQGLGKLLYQAAAAKLKELEILELELTVWSFNQSAADFYQELGFKPRYTLLEHKLDNK
ncbi:GNAT family N-acetyltransferase [Halanaerobium salsuginis]|uniref:Acetyltransferase (GNAT) family protein n=1 Tax=Halanaerobium salsuginis TaxID=29563 RepID=A0A1I4KD67_9FIRM|nr:GNAT family N-acetyltransferase [Halanaerobium salsuginis]SFL76772.1 Acetyltransferase (GNAT) family protein [Halanaerobium salsuginis]